MMNPRASSLTLGRRGGAQLHSVSTKPTKQTPLPRGASPQPVRLLPSDTKMEGPCPSESLRPSGMDDQLDSLVGLLQFDEAPAGLDDLLPSLGSDDLVPLEVLLKTEISSDNAATSCRPGNAPFSAFQHQHLRIGHEQQQLPADPANSTDAHDDEAGNDGKRRRRIRNAKQQELNRLAQQRYRQRKKQKYTDLQVTVDELSEKMAIIARLENEAGELRSREAAAQRLAASRAAALAQAHVAVQQQTVLLQQQHKKLGEQQQQLELLKQQKQQQASPPGSSSPRSSSPAPSSQPQQLALCDRLVAALRVALAEVCKEEGLHASSTAQEQVLVRFTRSLSSCCKEVLAAAVAPCDGPGAGAVALAAGPAVAGALVGVPAAVAGQAQEAACRLSVTCC